ncbi:MAG: hypothetical protein ACYTGI_00230 [Planctomycetota bacterium]
MWGLLLLVAAAAVVVLLWPRDEDKVRAGGGRAGAEPGPAIAVRLPPAAEPVGQAAAGARLPAAKAPAPPSGVEKGPCTLRLTLVADSSGVATEGWVELWRLALAETTEWTAGDQLQAAVQVDDDGHVFAGLPRGRYRVLVCGQRADVEDPPPIDVEGERTERTLVVHAPRVHRAYLRVFTETGDRLTRAAQITESEKYTRWSATPGWARPRRLKAGGSREGRGILSTGVWVSDQWGVAGAGRGFELCTFRERARRARWDTHVRFDPYGRSDIGVRVTGDLSSDHDYIGVAVSDERLYSLVLMPDGSLARDSGARFDAGSVAIPASAAKPWQSIPVKVTVTLDGYEGLEFTYRVDRPPAKQVMRPKPVSEPD